MTANGWKTIVVDGHCSIGYTQGCLKIEKDEYTDTYPLSEIKVIIIESLQVRISSYLMNEIIQNHIKIIFCDASHNPSFELSSYHESGNQSGHIRNQIAWDDYDKNIRWSEIVRQKIRMQIALLERLGKSVPEIMYDCVDGIELGDITNREAIAAKAYFSSLFGNTFSRSKICNINSALNYGYSILLSIVNRQVTASGYITNIGIHHQSEENPYNLSCDLMEPFRPFIDEIVYKNHKIVFDKTFKSRIIGSFYREMVFRNKRMELSTAIDMYVNSCLKLIGNRNAKIQEVAFG